MPAPKSLRRHVLERTFRSRRHHRLLGSEPLLDDPALAEIQQRYQGAESERERRELGVEFERALDVEPVAERGRKSPAELAAEFRATLRGAVEVDLDAPEFDTAREMRRLKVRDQYLEGMYRKNQDEPVRRGTLAEIAASVGVSPSTARRYLRELGVESRGRDRRAGA